MLCFGRSHKSILEQAKKDLAQGLHQNVSKALYPIVKEGPDTPNSPIYNEICKVYLQNYLAKVVSMDPDDIKVTVDRIEQQNWTVEPQLLAKVYFLQGKACYNYAFKEMKWGEARNLKDAQKHLKDAKDAFTKANDLDPTNSDAVKYTNPHKAAVTLFDEAEKLPFGNEAASKYMEAVRIFTYERVSDGKTLNDTDMGKALKALKYKAKGQEATDLYGNIAKLLGQGTVTQIEKSAPDATTPVKLPSANTSNAGTPEKGTPHGSPDKDCVYKSPMTPEDHHDYHHEITVGGHQHDYHSDH